MIETDIALVCLRWTPYTCSYNSGQIAGQIAGAIALLALGGPAYYVHAQGVDHHAHADQLASSTVRRFATPGGPGKGTWSMRIRRRTARIMLTRLAALAGSAVIAAGILIWHIDGQPNGGECAQ